MKITIELNDKGLSLTNEGAISQTMALGMVEHARTLLRARAVQSYMGERLVNAPVALRVCKHCLRAIRKTEDGDGWHDIGELSPKYCDKSPDTTDHEPLETYEVKL